MVMEESAMHHIHHPHSPSGGDAPNNNASNANVYLVGLEFVRQYYTVLNQGPLYLHRFYSDDSAFVHGVSSRDSKVAYGQQEIHKRIQSLNFHNCHAKIRQVDSHDTLGNGVVIQVTGELSNNGQPMRRFMQTFVLAPQTPKRYYVRNDIFHYQDEVFCDEEEGEGLGEGVMDGVDVEGEEIESESMVDVNGGSGIMPIPNEITPSSIIPPPVEVSAELSVSPSTINIGRVAPPKVEEEVEQVKVEPVTVSAAIPEPTVPAPVTAPITTSAVIVPAAPEEEPPVATTNPSAPKTFANLFKGHYHKQSAPAPPAKFQAPPSQNHSAGPGPKGNNGPISGSPNNAQFPVSVSTNDNSRTSPPQVSPQPGGTSAVKGLPPRNPRGQGGYGGRGDRQGGDNRPPMDRDVKERRERLTSRSSTTLNDETGSVDGDRRRPVHTYPDVNQLFVGNLPHVVTIQDMKDIFSEFGDVAEVKIQKPTPKSGGLKVPYFCFVVFEDASSAQAAIDRKSEIYMKMPGGGQRRLNVEQKRSQRSGRLGGDEDNSYNRMDAASPAGGRPSEGNRGNTRTFRGSNRSGGGGGGPDRDRNDHRDNRDNHHRGGHNMGRGGGGGGGGGPNTGRGGGLGPNRGAGGNKP